MTCQTPQRGRRLEPAVLVASPQGSQARALQARPEVHPELGSCKATPELAPPQPAPGKASHPDLGFSDQVTQTGGLFADPARSEAGGLECSSG